MSYPRIPRIVPGVYETKFESFGRLPAEREKCHLVDANGKEVLIEDLRTQNFQKFFRDLENLKEVGDHMEIKRGGPGESLSRTHAYARHGPEIAHNLLCFIHELADALKACREAKMIPPYKELIKTII